jgi:hypothetical protein
MVKFLDLGNHGVAFRKSRSTHIGKMSNTARQLFLRTSVYAETKESVGSHLASIRMHDGDDGTAGIDEALHISANKCGVRSQVGIWRSYAVQ